MARSSGNEPLVIGVDGGTEGVRAGVIDAAGRPIAFHRATYPTRHPHAGWAEQDPRDWWAATVEAVRGALGASGVSPEWIAGIAVAATSCSVLFCDAGGSPLRPALIWMDVRAAEEARRIAATGDPALKYSGYDRTSAEWLLSKVLWVAEHEPETYRESVHVLEYTDWLGFQLTGEWAANINTAAIRGYYDRHAGGWPGSLFEAVGLPDLIGKLPARVVDMGDLLGRLTPDAAEQIGLPAGLPVAEGGADAFVGMVGLDVVAPGKAAIITGSSHLHLAQTLTPTYSPGIFGAYTDAVIPGQYTIEGGQVSTGSVVRWLSEIVSGTHFGNAVPREQVFRALRDEAKRLPPGSDGVMILDFWQGNRTPYVDAEARGMIWGLYLAHTPAHLYRALLEAISYGTENIFRQFASAGHPIKNVVACGGALNSDLWTQIHADVSNLPIAIPRVTEAVTLGAAVLASVAAGIYPDIAAAAGTMVSVERYVDPRPDMNDIYQFYYGKYVASYEAMRELMHEVVTHVNK